MEFKEPKGIYLQIADQMCVRILQSEWQTGERIPSIRELAVELGVNPNTVTKSYQALLDRDVINNQRGRGYFVNENAKQQILAAMKSEFIREDLPSLVKAMRLLNIDINELTSYIENLNSEDHQ
ncbi:MAG: GntR family transcriptional regulator [Acidiferrobacterales bacterium]|nr:GntR family transcriptional regulator [Acidiferrobacterales bacterium]